MSAVTTETFTVPRADAPRDQVARPGLFSFSSTRLRGLSPQFWILQLYLFFALSLIDEHWTFLSDARPRFFLGALSLALLVGRGLAGHGQPQTMFRFAQARWLTAYAVACLMATVWAYDLEAATDPLIDHLISMVAFVLIVCVVRTRREFLITVLVFCAGVGTFLVLSFWEWQHGRHDYTMGVVRMMGIGSSNADPNSFGATIVFALPLMVWVLLHARSLALRVCAFAYCGMALIAAFYTSSRSALVLIGLTGIWTLWILPRGWPKVLAIACVVALGGGMAAGLSDNQVKRIQSLVSLETYTKEGSTVGRVEGYVVAWRIFKDNPVIGIGPGNWPVYRTRRVDGNALMPHNLAGQLIATRGLVGSLTFLGFLVTSFAFGLREIRKRKRRAQGAWDRAQIDFVRAMLFGLGLLLVSGLGAHNLTRSSWFWWSGLMIVACTCVPDPEDDEDATHADKEIA